MAVVVAFAERGSVKSNADIPSNPMPRRRTVSLQDNPTLRTVPLASETGEGRRGGGQTRPLQWLNPPGVAGVNHRPTGPTNQARASSNSRHTLVALRSTGQAHPTNH